MGATRSCGCLRRTHGLIQTREYGAWEGLRNRCNNPTNHAYRRYGGRGIKVCERWDSFENFLADMGPSPDGMSIDRIDNNGPYSPENCKWSTSKEQNRNRRDNRLITYKGQTKCLAEWAESTGISADTLGVRLDKLDWPIECALTKPVRRRSR